MRTGPIARASAAVALALMLACRGGATPESASVPTDQPKCEAGFVPPVGFRATETFEDPSADRVGVRLSFRDDQGRELHVFAGIRGEFGEGLPLAGPLELGSGEEVLLLGEDETWVIAWDLGGPCGSHAVVGNGFAKQGFIDVLEASGVIAPG